MSILKRMIVIEFVWPIMIRLLLQEEGPKEDEESDKSVSEVNDEDDAEDGSEEVSGLSF